MAGPYGRGRGRGFYKPASSLEMWENTAVGRPSIKSRIQPDPVTGCYKLYVRSIPKTWNELTVRNAFAKVCTPLAIYLSQPTHINLKWAFVEVATFEEAQDAVRFLNNNIVLDGIEVSFAKERSEVGLSNWEEGDPTVELLMHQSMSQSSVTHSESRSSRDPPINPKLFVKTVKNDQPLSSLQDLGDHVMIADKEKQKWVEEALCLKIQQIWKNAQPTGKCEMCKAGATTVCADCGTFYCSHDCQARDWPSHSRSCQQLSKSGSESGSATDLRGGGDAGKARGELSNGFKSHEYNQPRGNQYGDNRSQDGRSNEGDKRNSRFDSGYGNKQDGSTRFNRDHSRNSRDESEGPRNMFEERKSRFASNRLNQNEMDKKPFNQLGYQRDQRNSRSQSTQGGNDHKTDFGQRGVQNRDRPWNSSAQASNVNHSSGGYSVSSVNICEIRPPTETPAQTQEEVFKPGVVEGATISFVEDSFYYVQLKKQMKSVGELVEAIDKPNAINIPYTPVENGLCCAKYEGSWSRCQVTSLNPLTVKYIDFGNSETTSPDKLFTTPPELVTLPPFAHKVKLADGTPEKYLTLDDGEDVVIKPVLKTGDHWVVQVDGVEYPSVPAPTVEVKQETAPSSPKLLPPDVFTQVKQETPPAFPKLLPPDVFTQVRVMYRHNNTSIAVTPVSNLGELDSLMEALQANALSAASTTPQLRAKCMVKYSSKWYRGQVKQLEPLSVYLVDNGNTEMCSLDDLKALPPSLATIPAFIVNIKGKEGVANEVFYNDEFSVKPLYKDTVDNVWVVDVTATPKAENSDLKPTTVQPTFPALFPADQFTTVVITHPEAAENGQEGLYYVGPQHIWATLADMNSHFTKFTQGDCESLTLQHGALGITKFDDEWYRVKVVSLTPLMVQYIDFGNIEPKTPEQLKKCPETHKDVPRMVHRIQLAPNTNSKYFDLPSASELSVKPVSLLGTGTVVVQIEGESYDDSPTASPEVESSPPSELVTSTSTQDASVVGAAPVAEEASRAENVLADSSHTENVTAASEQCPPSVTSSPPDANQGNTPPPITHQSEFPPLLPADQFTTVVITHPESTENGHVESYYVASQDIWTSLLGMNSHFIKYIEGGCELLTPENGALGIALFENIWYRVKVVSVTPLMVHYIDFGNTSPVTPAELKKCPESHKDIPCMVHKIKLAPGTDSKHFNLSPETEIRVKPVSLLPTGTVVVQVEGGTDSETPIIIKQEPESPARAESNTSTSSLNQITQSPIVTPKREILHPPSPATTPKLEDLQQFSTVVSKPVVKQDTPNYSVELLQAKWVVTLMPLTVEFAKKVLVCSVFTENILETKAFMATNDFDVFMKTVQADLNFKPAEGEVAGCQVRGDWVRALVLADGLVAVVDLGFVDQCCEFRKLPAHFLSIPFMAAELTLPDGNYELMKTLPDETEISLIVDEVIDKDGERLVRVQGRVKDTPIAGELRAWKHDLLANAVSLNTGDLVTICKVIDSNILVICPADDTNRVEQIIQIECQQNSEQFQTSPKVGDYVAFFHQENEIFYRSRIEKIDTEKSEYTVFNIDFGDHVVTKLENLHPLPGTLSKLPRRATQVNLKDVAKTSITQESQDYISNIVEQGKHLRVEGDGDACSMVLTVVENNECFNTRLQELLTPKILPDLSGKFTLKSLPEFSPPLNKNVTLIVSQTEPLYLQLSDKVAPYGNLHQDIQIYCQSESQLYNPCENELCLALFDGEWYRSQCLRESCLGISSQRLIDYGNIFEVPTSNIRKIQPEMLIMPYVGLACKVIGLPSEISPMLKSRLETLLEVYTRHEAVIESEVEGYYQVNIPSLISTLKNEGLI